MTLHFPLWQIHVPPKSSTSILSSYINTHPITHIHITRKTAINLYYHNNTGKKEHSNSRPTDEPRVSMNKIPISPSYKFQNSNKTKKRNPWTHVSSISSRPPGVQWASCDNRRELSPFRPTSFLRLAICCCHRVDRRLVLLGWQEFYDYLDFSFVV